MVSERERQRYPALFRLRRELTGRSGRLQRLVAARAVAQALIAQLFLLPVLGLLAARNPYEPLWPKLLLATYAVYAWPLIAWGLAARRGAFALRRIAEARDRARPDAPDVFRTLLSLDDHSPETLDGLNALFARWEPRLAEPREKILSPSLRVLLAAALIAALGLPFLARSPGAVFYRMAFPVSAWKRIPLPRLEVAGIPGDAVLGDTVRAVVETEHIPASRRVYADIRPAGGGAEKRITLERRSGEADFRFGPVTGDFSVRFTAAGVRTPSYSVRALEPPHLRSLSVALHPPAYTRLPEEVLPEAPSVFSALPGTGLHWKGLSREPLRRVRVVFNSEGAVAETSEAGGGREFSWDRKIRTAGEARFLLTGATGAVSIAGPYRIGLKTDAPPEIVLLAPARDGDLAASLKVPVLFRARDDFGISGIRLVWSVQGAEGPSGEGSLDVSAWMRGSDGDGAGSWDASSLGLAPGSVVALHLEARDNDAEGSQLGRSETVRLRLPSPDEIRAAQEAAEKNTAVSLSSALERQKLLDREAGRTKRGESPLDAPPSMTPADVQRVLSLQPRDHLQRLQAHLGREAALAEKGSRLERQLQALREEARDMEARVPPPQVALAPPAAQKKSLELLTRDQAELDRKLSQLQSPPPDSLKSSARKNLQAERQGLRTELQGNLAEQKDLKAWLEDQERLNAERKRGDERAAQGSERVKQDMRGALDQIRETLRKGAENGTLSPEVLEKMQRVQELLEEVLTTDEKAGMRRERENQSVDAADLQRAVQDAVEQKDNLRQSLENAIRMLETLRTERALKNLAADVKAIQAGEEDVASRLDPARAPSDKAEALAERQSDLERRLEKSNREMDRLSRDPSLADLNRGAAPTEAQQARESMRKAENALRAPSPDRGAARKNASDAAKGLGRSAAALEEAIARLDPDAGDDAVAAALEETLEFARWLDLLRDPSLRAREGWEGSDAAVLQGAPGIARWLRSRLDAVADRDPFRAELLRRESAAMGFQADALAAAPSRALADSLGVHAHRAARELLKLLDRPPESGSDGAAGQNASEDGNGSGASGKGGGSGGESGREGLSGRLRGVSGKQMAVNHATFDLLQSFLQGRQGQPQGSGSGSSGAGQGGSGMASGTSGSGPKSEGGGEEGAGSGGTRGNGGGGTANAQQGVAETLEQLAEASGDAGGAARKLRQLAAEARALEENLRGRRLDPAETRKRQEQFQTRLLEAADALEERGQNRKRQAEAFRGGATAVPALPEVSEDWIRALERRRAEALKLPLSPDQKRRLEWYYEHLSEP